MENNNQSFNYSKLIPPSLLEQHSSSLFINGTGKETIQKLFDELTDTKFRNYVYTLITKAFIRCHEFVFELSLKTNIECEERPYLEMALLPTQIYALEPEIFQQRPTSVRNVLFDDLDQDDLYIHHRINVIQKHFMSSPYDPDLIRLAVCRSIERLSTSQIYGQTIIQFVSNMIRDGDYSAFQDTVGLFKPNYFYLFVATNFHRSVSRFHEVHPNSNKYMNRISSRRLLFFIMWMCLKSLEDCVFVPISRIFHIYEEMFHGIYKSNDHLSDEIRLDEFKQTEMYIFFHLLDANLVVPREEKNEEK